MPDRTAPENIDAKKHKEEQVSQLGIRIAEIRTEKNMTQNDVAGKMRTSLSGNLVSQYERGKMEMGVTMLFEFSQALGVPLNSLAPPELRSPDYPEGYERLNDEHKKIINRMVQALVTQQLVEARAAG